MWEQDGCGGPTLDSHGIPQDSIVLEKLVGRVRHTITSNQLEITVHEGRFRRRALPPRARWVLPRRMDRLPVTTVTRKALLLRP